MILLVETTQRVINMADKDVERNVRSTTEEGIKTPTQRHVQGVGEQHSITFGEKSEASRKGREMLLEKFKRREQTRKGIEEHREEEGIEPGAAGGESAQD
jgi:hypothetical protein